MKKRKTVITAESLFFVVSICMFTVRNSIIKEHDWKVTSGASLKNDFISFSEDSVNSYSCPLIRENGEIIAIALIQFEGRLLVFSTKEMAFSFLMYI